MQSTRRQRRRTVPVAAAPAAAVPPEATYVGLCEAARDQLLDGAPETATLTARRALEVLPHGLEAQRLLGLALLERGEARPSIPALQGALACDPLDAIAQAGIAEAGEQIGGAAASEGEWRRAWELAPEMADIAGRLQAARRAAGAPAGADGEPPLTRAALARIYLRGGLFEHAVTEARALLAREPDRADLQLLLAEAFWRLGDVEAAAGVAGALLEQMPDCVMANLLVAAYWQMVGRDVAALVERIRSVDPAGTVAAHLFDDCDPPPLLVPEAATAPWQRLEVAEPARLPEAAAGEETQPLPLLGPPAALQAEPAAALDRVPAHALVETPRQLSAAAPAEASAEAPVAPEQQPHPAHDATPRTTDFGPRTADLGPRPEAETPSPVAPQAPEMVAATATTRAEAVTVAYPEPPPILAFEQPAVQPAPDLMLEPIGPPAPEPVVTEGAGPVAAGAAGAGDHGDLDTPVRAQAAGDEAMRARRYLDAMRAYGAALRLLREQDQA